MIDLVMLIPLVLITASSWALTSSDFREHRLPNRITLPLIVITLTTVAAHAVISQNLERLIPSFIAAAFTFAIGYAMAKWLDFGMGDVKLLVSLNTLLAWHSPWLVLVALAIGFSLSSIWAVVVWLKTKNPKARIALGPYLILGFFVASVAPNLNLVTAVAWS